MFWGVLLEWYFRAPCASLVHPSCIHVFRVRIASCWLVLCVIVLFRAGSWDRVRGWARGYQRGWARGPFLRSERILFRQDDRTPITLLSLPIARVLLYSFASMPMSNLVLVTMSMSNHPTYANRCLAKYASLSPSYSIASCRWRSKMLASCWSLVGFYHTI